MKKNLETADHIVKVVLASSVIVLFYARLIAGAFAIVLVILSFCVLMLFAARILYKKCFPERNGGRDRSAQ